MNGVAASRVKRQVSRLNQALDEAQVAQYAVSLTHFVEQLKDAPLSGIDLERLYTYRVPATDPDGCSRIDGTLAAEPYDLRDILGLPPGNGLISRKETRKLFALDRLVEKVASDTGINWLGFYQRRRKDGTDVLVKLVYRGSESRAEFPLTKEFSRKSNNSTVGLTGMPTVINDIEKYLWEEGGPYYQCDSKVHSEACLPIFSPGSDNIIGILDAECFARNRFTTRELTMLVGTAIVLEGLLEEF